jgi:predicted porin
MKKSLIALTILGAFAGVASAQSSVTLFGIVDVNGRYVKNEGSDRRISLGKDGLQGSRLGVRGVEDLGGGLKAGFHIEGAMDPDTGTAGGQTWQRRSTLSLMGGFGEVRLGRDFTPTYTSQTDFDPFGDNGVGASTAVGQLKSETAVRASNSAAYFLPSNLGGAYGTFMVSAAESSTVFTGKYLGGRVGFASGPFDAALAYGQQDVVRTAATTERHKTYNVGGSYNFGVVKVLGYVNRDTRLTQKDTRFSLGAVVPVMTQGEVHLAGQRSKLTNSVGAGTSNTVKRIALGYQHNLSKRTAVYSNVSRLSNGDLSNLSLSSGTSISALPSSGGKSTGFEVGVRHRF